MYVCGLSGTSLDLVLQFSPSLVEYTSIVADLSFLTQFLDLLYCPVCRVPNLACPTILINLRLDPTPSGISLQLQRVILESPKGPLRKRLDVLL